MKHFLFIFFIVFSSIAFSQPIITWQKCIGGTDGEQGVYVSQTHDNGFIVAGDTYSSDGDILNNHGSSDVLIIRFDSTNNVMWKKTYGGSSDEGAVCIIETPDHGFIFTAGTESNDGDVSGNHGDNDIWIVKIDSIGNLLWQKTFGDTTYDEAFSIIQNTNGNYVIGGWISKGYYDEDFCLICIDPSGNLMWQKTYGGTDTDWGYQVIQTIDGGYMLSGWTYSNDGDVSFNHGEEDVWLVKTDASGNLQWEKTYGGSEDDYGDNIIQLANGEYVFAAAAESIDGDVQNSIEGPDYWIVKIDPTGNILSQKIYGGTDFDEPYRMIRTQDGGFLVTGFTSSYDVDISGNHGYDDAWTLKLDSNLNKVWSLCSGGTDEDEAIGVCQLASGDYLLTGYAYSNDGDVSGNHGGGYEDIWTFRLSTSTGVPEIFSGNEINVFPNPAASEIYLNFHSNLNQNCSIEINDVCGRCALKKAIDANTGLNKVQLDIRNLDSGVYFFTINLKEGVFSKRIVIN